MRFLQKFIIVLSITLIASGCSSTLPKEVEKAKKAEADKKYEIAKNILLAAEKKFPNKAAYPYHLGLLYERRFAKLFHNKLKTITIEDTNFKPIGEAILMRSTNGRALGYMLRDLTPVIAPFLRSIKKDKLLADAYIRAGRLYAHMGRYKDSIKILKKGTQQIPKSHDIPHLLGYIYDHQKMYSDAVTYYSLAEKNRPNYSATSLNLALALFALNKNSEAILAMQRTINAGDNKKNRNNAIRYVFRYYKKSNLHKKAAAWGKKHSGFFKKRPFLSKSLGKALYLSGDYAASKEYLTLAHRHNKKDWLTHALLGQLALSEKKYKIAEKHFLESLTRKKKTQVLYQLGTLYIEIFKSPARAAKFLKLALQKSPNHYMALFQLALAYEQTSAPRTLRIKTWRRYISLAKNIPSEKEYLKNAQRILQALTIKKR